MKFFCDNCKQKYQIPDEKILGKTMRMKCRKCDHDIVIRGPRDDDGMDRVSERPISVTAEDHASIRPASVAPEDHKRRSSSTLARPGSQAARRPGSLTADFRRPASEPPGRPAVEWFVAVNDVPVGPIQREEVARKIGMGAVTASSLCWREGFDDWKPVGQVDELKGLLEQRRLPPKPPAPSRPPGPNVVSMASRMPPTAHADDSLDHDTTTMAPRVPQLSRPPAHAPVRTPSVAPHPVAPHVSHSAAAAPVLSRSVAPEVEPNFVAPSVPPPAPPSADWNLPAPSPISDSREISVAAPILTPAMPDAQRRGLPIGAWIGIAGAAAFGIAMAVIVGARIVAAPVVAPSPTPEPSVPVAAAAATIPIVEAEEPALAEEPVAEEEVQPTGQGARTSRVRATATPMTDTLSDEERERLARISGGGFASTPQAIETASASGSSSMAPLEDAAVVRVVGAPANQRALRRCWEGALRSNPEAPETRLDIALRVAPAGTVQNVTVNGNDVGGLKSCIQTAVRRWRFPASSDGAQTSFPLVLNSQR